MRITLRDPTRKFSSEDDDDDDDESNVTFMKPLGDVGWGSDLFPLFMNGIERSLFKSFQSQKNYWQNFLGGVEHQGDGGRRKQRD